MNTLKDQRGVAMLFEILLVVAVLSMVGYALLASHQEIGRAHV